MSIDSQTHTKIAIVTSSDWEGMYVNGELRSENHSLSAMDALKVLAEMGIIVFLSGDVDESWLEDAGGLPADFEEVKLETDFSVR